ncbi:hypothetical protein [Serratia plymuthica]|nr:hypothetical protein [Serratia plymuthica]
MLVNEGELAAVIDWGAWLLEILR